MHWFNIMLPLSNCWPNKMGVRWNWVLDGDERSTTVEPRFTTVELPSTEVSDRSQLQVTQGQLRWVI